MSGDGWLTAPASSQPLDVALEHYRTHGYARLGVQLSDRGLIALREQARRLMTGEVRHQGMFFQHDAPSGRYEDLTYGAGWVGPSLAYRKLEGLERDGHFRAWIENPLFRRIAAEVLGVPALLYRAVLWNKAPHGGTVLPWHQDDGRFWGINRSPCLQLWTALDDAGADAGCVEVLPGSHRSGLASREGGTVQATSLEEKDAESRKVQLPARAGEVIVLHNHVWHRSGVNGTGQPRRALGFSYLHADTQCLRKRRAPRQFTRVFADTAEAAKLLATARTGG
ncbi:MAG: phytanoyl-CoA dioxygenase family protein [Pseudomonadota bacterium]